LVAPQEDELEALEHELGPLPSNWQPVYKSTNTGFRRWLRNQGLHDVWKNVPSYRAAEAFLYAGRLRQDFQVLMLAHGDLLRARTELVTKYGEHVVPEVQVLETFSTYFWDLGGMSQQGRWDFFQLLTQQEAKDIQAANEGDLTKTYALLGIRRRVQAMDYYEAGIALGYKLIQDLARADRPSASKIQAVATMARVGAELVKDRDLLLAEDGEDGDLTRRAQQWKLRMIEQQENRMEIPSIEEVVASEPIDVDYEEVENADNVHEFPAS